MGLMGYVRTMRFSEADHGSGYHIEGYGAEGVRVDGRLYDSGLMITPNAIEAGWGPMRAERLSLADVERLLAFGGNGTLQVLIIGTGATQVFPDPKIYFSVLSKGIGFEIMDTGAACRTFNILMAEGRRVVAGLMPWVDGLDR